MSNILYAQEKIIDMFFNVGFTKNKILIHF